MLSKLLFGLAALALIACSVNAATGVDVSDATSQSTFECLKNDGLGDFAIIRGYRSSGSVDPNCVASIKAAKAAGIKYVDVYLFPDVSKGNPSGQVKDLHSAIQGTGYGMIWLDVEVYNWSSDKSSNQAFITDMLSECKSLGAKCGIYTNANNWSSIVGDWSGAKGQQLWYAHYDNSKSFSDFRSFGGWSKPNMKQYAGDKTECGHDVDLNWY